MVLDHFLSFNGWKRSKVVVVVVVGDGVKQLLVLSTEYNTTALDV